MKKPTNTTATPEVITRYAGLDNAEVTSQIDAINAITRRLAQAKSIVALMGDAADTDITGGLPEYCFSYVGWAARDLLNEADMLAQGLHKLPLRRGGGE